MRAFPAWVLVFGCGGPVNDPEAFESEFAQRWCARQEECALGDYQRSYESAEDCWDDKQDDPGIKGGGDGCELDPDGASACLDYLSATDCAGWDDKEIEQACENAYRC